MDLLSLPDEMLTNVLKYGKRGRVRSLRRMNQRIDQLARRANLTTRAWVNELQLSPSGIRIYVTRKQGRHLRTRYDFLDFDLEGTNDYAKILDEWLNSVMIEKALTIEDFTIDSGILDVIQKHKDSVRSIKSITFNDVSLVVSPDRIQMVLSANLPNLNFLRWESHSAESTRILCNEKVFDDRKWYEVQIVLHYELRTPCLEDSFIVKVAPNSVRFWTDVRTMTCTVSGAIEMLRKCIDNLNSTRRWHNLGLLSLDGMPVNEIDSAFRSIKPGVIISSELRYSIKTFVVNSLYHYHSVILNFHVDVREEERKNI